MSVGLSAVADKGNEADKLPTDDPHGLFDRAGWRLGKCVLLPKDPSIGASDQTGISTTAWSVEENLDFERGPQNETKALRSCKWS